MQQLFWFAEDMICKMSKNDVDVCEKENLSTECWKHRLNELLNWFIFVNSVIITLSCSRCKHLLCETAYRGQHKIIRISCNYHDEMHKSTQITLNECSAKQQKVQKIYIFKKKATPKLQKCRFIKSKRLIQSI